MKKLKALQCQTVGLLILLVMDSSLSSAAATCPYIASMVEGGFVVIL